MMKRPTACLLALLLAGSLCAPAAALPEDTRAIEKQQEICKTGLNMIVNGSTDDEEFAFYRRALQANGWTEPEDFDDLLVRCLFYKYGWLQARTAEQ